MKGPSPCKQRPRGAHWGESQRLIGLPPRNFQPWTWTQPTSCVQLKGGLCGRTMKGTRAGRGTPPHASTARQRLVHYNIYFGSAQYSIVLGKMPSHSYQSLAHQACHVCSPFTGWLLPFPLLRRAPFVHTGRSSMLSSQSCSQSFRPVAGLKAALGLWACA